jgi:hypothetical protein
VVAQVKLGEMYSEGHGVPKNYSLAAQWFRKAADQGNAEAQASLGQLYVDGHGVPQDPAAAASWFRKAADQGSPRAQYDLGQIYKTGHKVPLDYGQAYFWLDLAAASSSGPTQEKFARSRDEAAGKLTPEQLVQAQDRASKWFATHATRP